MIGLTELEELTWKVLQLERDFLALKQKLTNVDTTLTGITSLSAGVPLAGAYRTTFTATSSKTITHNLGVKDVVVEVYDSSNNRLMLGWQPVNANSLTLTFNGTLTNARVVVIG